MTQILTKFCTAVGFRDLDTLCLTLLLSQMLTQFLPEEEDAIRKT
jgi:hypothetical protein